jgi:HK97 family phage prohead protease
VTTELFARTFALDSIEIKRAEDGGDGRTVTAYAAVFDSPTEIRDQFGHYHEVIARTAFNKTIAERGPDRVSVMFNHALTEYGTPSELGSVPVARCVEIRPDGRGLLTVSRYNRSALADAVLESIKNGEIRGQSFRGGIYQSTPYKAVPSNVARSGPVPTITRTELGLKEYGPTRTPYYEDAKILAVRSAPELAAALAALPEDERAEFAALIRSTLTTRPDGEPAGESGTGDIPAAELEPPTHSTQITLARARLRRSLALNGVRHAP